MAIGSLPTATLGGKRTDLMIRGLKPHLTYANVGVSICLFILLGGGAYAATHLPKNSVGSKQIQDGAVESKDVGNGALSSKDFAPGALSDTPEQIRSKLQTVDGEGSGIDADTLDGKSSDAFLPAGSKFVAPGWNAEGTARLGFDGRDVPAGETALYVFGVQHLVIHYVCPADPMTTNGTAYIGVDGAGGNLFIDAGGENPTYIKVPAGGFQTPVETARTGESLTIQYQIGEFRVDENLTTILFFSVGRPGLQGVNNGFCHLQGQIMDGTAN